MRFQNDVSTFEAILFSVRDRRSAGGRQIHTEDLKWDETLLP